MPNKKTKVANKRALHLMNSRSLRERYNRVLSQEFIDSLPDDINFLIDPIMVHEHRGGKPCAPHMRCFLFVPNRLTGTIDEMADSGFRELIVDFDIEMLACLPKIEDCVDAESCNSTTEA